MRVTIDAVLSGRAVPFGPRGEPSAIAKRPLDGAVAVTALGLAGDEQGDPRAHGGPDKAVHFDPRDHYPSWADEQPQLAPALAIGAGAFGENVSARGLTEADLCIGDRWRLGTALIELSQGRQPCWKLNVRFGWRGMAAAVQASGRTGCYFRVIEEGRVAAGDELALVERPHGDFPLPRLQHAIHARLLDRDELAAIAALPALAQSWRRLAERRLTMRTIESWDARLNGEA